jgi:hypothetical protein
MRWQLITLYRLNLCMVAVLGLFLLTGKIIKLTGVKLYSKSFITMALVTSSSAAMRKSLHKLDLAIMPASVGASQITLLGRVLSRPKLIRIPTLSTLKVKNYVITIAI